MGYVMVLSKPLAHVCLCDQEI